ncbi:MFS transporter [Streptomyces chilikensis]|uniref:MFS transporter n=1 Tax=Streptomyces chilikensis TaxID=1194079 RepID=UPI00140A5E85|nr:MFS transporter [Streptomyces chilikensis]
MTTGVSSDGRAAPAVRADRRGAVLGVICLVQLVVVLDNSVLTVAVPTLSRELDASMAAIQWVVNAYPLAQAGLLLAAGAAADRYGRRRLLLTGLALFGLCSLAAGLCQDAGQLVAARAGMGMGGALITCTTLAVLIQVFPEGERGRAIGIWAAVNGLGFAAGPPLGGLILSHLPWGAIFLVNVPVALVGLAAARWLIPESRREGAGRPDVPGAVLSAVGVVALVHAVTSWPEHGAVSLPVLAATGTAVAALTALVVWERRCADPVLAPQLFRSARFTGAVTGVLLITFGSAGALFLLAQQLQYVRGYTALEAGLCTAPFPLSVVLLNIRGLAPRMIARLGEVRAVALGMGSLACGFAVAGVLDRGGYPVLLTGLLLMGLGCALANPAIVEAVMGSIPPDRAGSGAAVDGTVGEVGGSLGVAVLGAVLSSRLAALQPQTADAASLTAALEAAGPEDGAAVLGAFAAAARTGQMYGVAAVMAGGLVTAYLLRRAGLRDGPRGGPAPRDDDPAPRGVAGPRGVAEPLRQG